MGDLPLSQMMVVLFMVGVAFGVSFVEAAMKKTSKVRLKNFLDDQPFQKKQSVYILQHFDRVHASTVISKNVLTIIVISLSASIFIHFLGESIGVLVSVLCMMAFVLFFLEALPAIVVGKRAEKTVVALSTIIISTNIVFLPVTYCFSILHRFFSKGVVLPSVTEQEIKVLVDISEEEGIIDNREKELVHRSLEFDEILVGEILTPRTDVIAVEISQPLEEIRDLFLEQRYSRIPVYQDHIDNIIGILSEREFLSELVKGNNVEISSLVRQPIYVVESMKISVLLPELQQNKVHLAVVVDEFGGTSGIVTLEDILEEIVGEIWDEHDEAVKNVHRIDEHNYQFNAELSLDEFVKMLNITQPESSYHTLGGWVFEQFERIPLKGERFQYEDMVLTVDHVENRRIRKVLVKIMNPNF
ncbi:hemolysin family protein [Priestia koreensis]|uniref:hemolysin family protein n=1 Tax=Priestia koreensis TaxID=284581 RepID=UPI001F596875|nr:hemolysin family protein [Priestia koreensis]